MVKGTKINKRISLLSISSKLYRCVLTEEVGDITEGYMREEEYDIRMRSS